MAVEVEVEVEQLRRVGEIDLVDVVVDRPAGPAGEVGDGEAVEGESGAPAPPVEAGEVLHQVDLVGAPRIAVLGHRVDEDALGPVLALLGAEEDAHRRPPRGLGTGPHAERDDVRLLTLIGPGTLK